MRLACAAGIRFLNEGEKKKKKKKKERERERERERKKIGEKKRKKKDTPTGTCAIGHLETGNHAMYPSHWMARNLARSGRDNLTLYKCLYV
jgi:hypothetical protein